MTTFDAIVLANNYTAIREQLMKNFNCDMILLADRHDTIFTSVNNININHVYYIFNIGNLPPVEFLNVVRTITEACISTDDFTDIPELFDNREITAKGYNFEEIYVK